MTIEDRLDEDLKAAMKARDRDVLDVIRMVKSRLSERRTSPGFRGPMTDAVAAEVIEAYVKSLGKAIEEIERGGAADNPIVRKYRFEIEYLQRYLPKRLDEDQTRALVRRTVAELGVSGPQAIGRVMGAIMKAHKDEVDGAMVRRILEEELAKQA